ncbi:MAG: hypothetical protein LKI80_16010 [Sporolactobacillus sp.]|jgi:hypothetical protein|nr:hypothetical protein [Sporolactobacillus sp.]
MFTSEFIRQILQMLVSSAVLFISLTGVPVLCGLILGLLERQSNNWMIRMLGMKGIYWTAWLGTPIHELGHAVMCFVFAHHVTGIKLFQKVDTGGTIGYVTHTFNPASLYQRIGNFYIGLAPLLSGSLAIFAAAVWFVPDSASLLTQAAGNSSAFSLVDPSSWPLFAHEAGRLLGSLPTKNHVTSQGFWLFFVFSLCVASHMSLSREDVRGATDGVGALAVLIIVADGLSAALDPQLNRQIMTLLGRLNFFLLLLLCLAIFFSLIKWAISGIMYACKRLMGRRAGEE